MPSVPHVHMVILNNLCLVSTLSHFGKVFHTAAPNLLNRRCGLINMSEPNHYLITWETGSEEIIFLDWA